MTSEDKKALILKRFKETGLSSNEVKSYLTLLQRQTLTVPEVSKLAGIPLPNAYRSLEKLMSKGLCVSKPGPAKKYSASDPSLLEDKLLMQVDETLDDELGTFKEKLRRSLRAKENEISQKRKAAKGSISDLVKELKPQYETSREQSNPLDFIEIIRDPYQIHKRFIHLVGEAKEEILVFTKPPFSRPREDRDERLDQETEALKGGIRGRCIYEIATDEEERRWLSQHIHRAVRAGEEARVLEELPMKMAIFDSRIVLFALTDPVSKQISLTSQVVEHPALAKSLKILFETLWERAEDYRILTG